jgi:hypothetical protein
MISSGAKLAGAASAEEDSIRALTVTMTALSDAERERDFINDLRLLAEEYNGVSFIRRTVPVNLAN